MKMSDLMYFLGEVPFKNRSMDAAKEFGIDFEKLIVYHVTKSASVDSINNHGIQARSSKQSYDRPESVYFFVDRNEINRSTLDILGLLDEDCTIIKVAIPVKDVVSKMRWDGLFNATFNVSCTAVQYMDSVPAAWIMND
jgi:hypothetical protein